jgi:hypothetical protein
MRDSSPRGREPNRFPSPRVAGSDCNAAARESNAALRLICGLANGHERCGVTASRPRCCQC